MLLRSSNISHKIIPNTSVQKYKILLHIEQTGVIKNLYFQSFLSKRWKQA